MYVSVNSEALPTSLFFSTATKHELWRYWHLAWWFLWYEFQQESTTSGTHLNGGGQTSLSQIKQLFLAELAGTAQYRKVCRSTYVDFSQTTLSNFIQICKISRQGLSNSSYLHEKEAWRCLKGPAHLISITSFWKHRTSLKHSRSGTALYALLWSRQ